MKLPSCTLRTRSSAGSKVSVSETVESRETFTIEIGTVYGPAPTRNVVPGGERITCASPTPGVVIGGSTGAGGGRRRGEAAPACGAAADGAAAGGAASASGGCGGAAGGGCGGTTTVPGTGVVPGGGATMVPPGPA